MTRALTELLTAADTSFAHNLKLDLLGRASRKSDAAPWVAYGVVPLNIVLVLKTKPVFG